jgi:hypothetical protein
MRTKPYVVAWSSGDDSVQNNSFLHTGDWRRQTSVFKPDLLSSQGRKDTVITEELLKGIKFCTSKNEPNVVRM